MPISQSRTRPSRFWMRRQGLFPERQPAFFRNAFGGRRCLFRTRRGSIRSRSKMRSARFSCAKPKGCTIWSPASEITLGPQPAVEFPPVERRGDGDWMRMGEEQELNGKLFAALESYRELLKKFPTSYLGLK